MGLSRLDNFLKSTRGEILYVDPSSIDSTDSIENKGNSLTRPFKTIQRALIEAARFSYQKGIDNDRFGKTTILLYPGEHLIDNRPGWIPDGRSNFRLRNGTSSDDFGPFDINTNFNIASENNSLYKMNSIHGGVIIPRGTSIVGYDLRKTKIRPKYIPNPDEENGANIQRSAIFRVTGACYLWQFSIFDADPNIPAYYSYSTDTAFPKFSHHKLTCFEYADGVNPVTINDEFIQNFSTSRTDLDMYYEKVGIAYGESSDRGIANDYPSSEIDIQPKIDEYLIVGSRGDEIGISSIRAGNGTVSSNIITVDLSEPFENIDVDSPIQIKGIGPEGYNGQQVVSKVLSKTQIQYKVQIPPQTPNIPSPPGATLSLILDTVNSASPYIFNCSLRSVYGMCGMHADGDKAGGFKSMVVAQFTGIGLQKDNKAFVKYNQNRGQYEDELTSGDSNIYSNSLAKHKPSYESYHIKCSNNAFIQVVSVFAIGFTRHFFTESGGDLSITNSNSNFGANSLTASGFRNEAFLRDDVGYITHIIPPKEIDPVETSSEFDAIDVSVTLGVGLNKRLYLYNRNSLDLPPNHILDGYRIGAKTDDKLYLSINQGGVVSDYFAKITIPDTSDSKEKVKYVNRNNLLNDISDNVINFSTPHSFNKNRQGEKIRIISEDGNLPDGLEEDQVYYAITSGTNITSPTTQIKIAKTLNDAINDVEISINDRGGLLKVVSRVSDKKPNEEGHPIQWDSSTSQWYISVEQSGADNTIYDAIFTLNSLGQLGDATPRTYIERIIDTRTLSDTLYRFRYVIPANSSVTARPPSEGFIIQESNTTTGSTDEEVTRYFRNLTDPASLQNVGEIRNFRFISNAIWTSGTKTATITSEVAHNLTVGSEVQIKNIKSTLNPNGVDNIGFNGTFIVTEVSSRRTFKYTLNTNPGIFTSNTSVRTEQLPRFSRKQYNGIYSIYRSEEIKKYVKNEQDGVYHLIVTNSSNSPSVSPFQDVKLSQQIQNLYPRTNRDEPISDPDAAKSFAVASPIGKVIVNDPEKSLSKETVENSLIDFNVGIGISNITSISIAGTSHNLITDNDHGLNRVISVNVVPGFVGSNYGSGLGVTETYYNAQLISQTGIGSEASARVVVSSAGTIANVQIMDGGSSYAIGDVLSVVGIATTTGFTEANVVVTNVYNNIGDNIKVSGIFDPNYKKYNGIYKITSIISPRTIRVSSLDPIPSPSLIGIGQTELKSSYIQLTGSQTPVISYIYSSTSGIATFATSQSHGLYRGNRVIISGATDPLFNGDFIVDKIINNTVFSAKVGIKEGSVPTTGSVFVNHDGVSSRGGLTSKDNENVFERMIFNYGNLTTTLSASATVSETNNIAVSNAYDLKIGDFILINNEIMRIRSTVTGNSLQVYRGLMSTEAQSHNAGSLVRKINIVPVEFRRNSILRASGHTFEYLGFGPGNYSTAFPERQDRQLTPQEELFAQSAKFSAGSVIFTGMNSDGDFYIGNKKLNSSGKGETFDTPIPSVTGESTTSSSDLGIDYVSPDVVSASKFIVVEGGPESDNISKFNGPVIFNKKITSNSADGIEANNLLLQGDARISRRYTVGISTPSIAGNPGDVVFDSAPNVGGYIGWVYTNQNNWSRFGGINLSDISAINYYDQLIVKDPSYSGAFPFKVGSGAQQFSIDTLGNVGIGTNPDSSAILKVNGKIVGDGSGLTNVSDIWITSPVVDETGTPVVPSEVGITTRTRVGINTSNPRKDFGLYVEGTMAINGSLRVFEIIEKATIDARLLTNAVIPIYLANNNVYYFPNNNTADPLNPGPTGNWTLHFRGELGGKIDLGGNNGFLDVGESMTVAIISNQGSKSFFNSSIQIDGSTIIPRYYGGEPITSGNPGSLDVYTYVIVRIAGPLAGPISNQFIVLYSQAQYK
jgi:hypothetical protein